MLWITPIAECSIFNSMQPKFYEVMLATRQTAHLINLGLSINSLINCYHSRAWKIHQQVHGSPGNETPHHILQQCSADAYLPRDWLQGNLWCLASSFGSEEYLFLVGFLLFCFSFVFFFLTSHTNESWKSRVPRQALLESMHGSYLSIHHGTSGWASRPTSSLPSTMFDM